jgi:MFS family permease
LTDAKPLDRGLIVAMMLGLFVAGLDSSVVNIMLPKLQAVFETTSSMVMLVSTVYLTAMGAFQLFFGRCADLLEPVRIFFLGVVLFFIGSLGCALSSTILHMLMGRGLQGLGGAMLSASIGGVILTNFPREKTGSVLGSVFMVMGVGTIMGPPLGGYLAQNLSWHWAFVINLPLCFVAGLLLFLRLQPMSDYRARLVSLDLKGGILSVIMLSTLPAIFSLAAAYDAKDVKVWGTVLAFVGSSMLFLRVERRSEHPLLQLAIFKDRRLNLTGGIRILLYMAFNGVLLVFPFFLTGKVGLNVSQAGWLMLACAGTMAFTTKSFGAWTDRAGSETIALGGAAALTSIAVTALWLDGTSILTLGVVLMGFGVTVSAVMVASSVKVLKLAPKGQEGVFSALNFLMVPVGGSIGVALFSYIYATGRGDSATGFHNAMGGVAICAAMIVCLAAVLRSGQSVDPTSAPGGPTHPNSSLGGVLH